MADQNVKLKIGADTSEIEKAFGALIKKIQGDADKLKIAPKAAAAAPAGSPGYQSFQQTFQATRAQEIKTKIEQQAQQIALNKLRDIDRQLATNARNEAKSDRDKIFAEREKNQLLKERITLQGTLTRLAGGGGGAAGGGGGAAGGFGGNIPKGGITSITGLLGALGLPMGILATGIAAGSAAEGVRKFTEEASNRARVAQASAFNMQGQGGQRLESFLNGGANEEIMFNPQRKQAEAIAEKTMQDRLQSQFRIFSRPLETLLGRGSAHATGPGGLRTGAFTVDQFGLGTDAMKDEIAANQAKERATIQAEQFEATKNGPQGKLRTTVGDKFLKDWRRNLDFQRQTGQSEEQFRQFLGEVNSAGFQDEQGMQAASAISGAGGGTRAAKGNAAFALQMGRQFDLTNAGQAIGNLGGQLGSAEMSKEALIKIQAEGTRIGVNQSDFRDENRKFVEMASNIIGQSNATSGAGVDQILSTFSKFMGGANTMTGMEAGKTAYEAFQRQSNIQTGPSAVLRTAGMRGDDVLGQLSERDRAKLSLMPESEITTDSQFIQSLAKGDPKKAQAIVDSYHKVIGNSLFINPTTDKAITKLREAQKKITGPVASGAAYGESFKNVSLAEGEAAGEISLEAAGAGMSEKVRLQYARARAAGDNKQMAQLQEDIKNQAESNKNVRPGDEMNKQQAEASRLANELFTSIQKSIVPAASDVAIFTGKINELVAAMKGSDTSRINAAINALGSSATPPPLNPSDQTHAGTGGAPTKSLGTHF